jgi:iron uptake system EfeUOB component EfeO/EfeM
VTSIAAMPGARAARRLLSAGAAAVVLAIPIAGCGHAASVSSDRTLRVALSEYQVVPQNVQVSSGQLTIIVHNVGKMTHNLVVLQGTTRVDETQPIWPGTVSEMSVFLSPGKYTLASTLFSDQALGEYGTLTVTS